MEKYVFLSYKKYKFLHQLNASFYKSPQLLCYAISFIQSDFFIQTSFVDCLMEQTHQDIAKSENKDVSIHYC